MILPQFGGRLFAIRKLDRVNAGLDPGGEGRQCMVTKVLFTYTMYAS